MVVLLRFLRPVQQILAAVRCWHAVGGSCAGRRSHLEVLLFSAVGTSCRFSVLVYATVLGADVHRLSKFPAGVSKLLKLHAMTKRQPSRCGVVTPTHTQTIPSPPP